MLLVNTSLVVASLLLLAALAETALSIGAPILYRPRVTRIDPVLGWTHNPSSVTQEKEGHPVRVTYNAHGYRAPDHAFENLGGQRRVVVIGDSFVDGAEVDDTELHTAHLQSGLTNVEVINLGVYGYSTAQELLTLERVGIRYGPDVVVLVTITNDYGANVQNFDYFGPAPRFRLDGDSLVLEPTTGPAAQETFRTINLRLPLMTWLHRHSTLYYVLNHHIYQRLAAARIADLFRSQVDAVPREDRLELYRRLVLRMKAVSEEAGADFLLVFGYLRNEVVGSDLSPNLEVAQQLAADGVDVYDLFEDLKEAEASSPESLWYQEDIHWTALGHLTVAHLLQPKLEERLGRREAGR